MASDATTLTVKPPFATGPATGIVLAPMEGVIDAGMRELLCAGGNYQRCVTEFVRVTDLELPAHVFRRFCPELATDGHTADGTPVYVQLLGSNPQALAANARRAAELGAPGIDLNFGCPAKTVNRRQGGSVLLRDPQGLTPIISAVRDATPAAIPVTVKIRLGYDSTEELEDIARAVRLAGADELAIHARTKFDGYRPPAHWPRVAAVADPSTRINGEIWSVSDARAALAQSGCRALMLGRGALAAPDLAARITKDSDEAPQAWEAVVDLVEKRFVDGDCHSTRHTGNRTKQWLAYLKRHYPAAQDLFSLIRPLHDEAGIRQAFAEHRAEHQARHRADRGDQHADHCRDPHLEQRQDKLGGEIQSASQFSESALPAAPAVPPLDASAVTTQP
jgi:tRNA-dihydrouridine synthase C